MDKYLSTKEAQKFLGGISRKTLARWRALGMKAYTVCGRVLYAKDDLVAWVTKHREGHYRINGGGDRG